MENGRRTIAFSTLAVVAMLATACSSATSSGISSGTTPSVTTTAGQGLTEATAELAMYGVPALMGVQLRRELVTGERVRVQYSATAQGVDAYHGGELVAPARIWEV